MLFSRFLLLTTFQLRVLIWIVTLICLFLYKVTGTGWVYTPLILVDVCALFYMVVDLYKALTE